MRCAQFLGGDVVAMMQTAEAWQGHNRALWTVHCGRSWVRRVLVQAEVSAIFMVVVDVF